MRDGTEVPVHRYWRAPVTNAARGTETGVRSGLHGTGVAHGRRVRQRGGRKGGRMGRESAAARRLQDGYSDAGVERAQR
jgi:hypothetical protein